MKLLIWSQYFWPENFLINKLATDLQQRGIEVTVLTGKPNYPEGKIYPGYTATGVQREKLEGIDVVRIPMIPRGNGSAVGLILNYMSFVFSGYLSAPLVLRKKHFDTVFVFAPSPLIQALPALFVAWLKRAPLAVWVQDIWPEALQATGYVRNRFLLRLVESAVRYIYKHADLILIQSEAFRVSVERLVDDRSKIHYHPNSTGDLTRALVRSARERQLAAEIDGHFSVLFTGNIGSAQSCETIVAAAERLREYPQIRFFLIGTGSRVESVACDVKIRKLGNVIMTGQLPTNEMHSVLSAASVLLVSLKDDIALARTIPSKLQTYMSAGKPILAAVSGEAARIVIDADAGFSCPAEDPEALAAAVLRLYALTADERSRLGTNARRYFEQNFHVDNRVSELVDQLKELANHN